MSNYKLPLPITQPIIVSVSNTMKTSF